MVSSSGYIWTSFVTFIHFHCSGKQQNQGQPGLGLSIVLQQKNY